MPASKQHFIAASVVAGTVNALTQWAEIQNCPGRKFDWGELAVSGLAGGVVGLLPDILEPAASPNHRKFFHSMAAAGLVGYAVSGRHTEAYTPELRRLLQALAASYLSHLALDGGTPMGIGLV